MQVRGDRNSYEVACAFAPIEGMDALFGQRGFFENYKVVFEKYKNQFEIVAQRGAALIIKSRCAGKSMVVLGYGAWLSQRPSGWGGYS